MPRPSKYPKYDPAFCTLAYQMGNKGATYEQIAETIGIPMRTLRRWEREHPEMFSALTPAYKAELRRRLWAQAMEQQQAWEKKLAKRRETANAR